MLKIVLLNFLKGRLTFILHIFLKGSIFGSKYMSFGVILLAV